MATNEFIPFAGAATGADILSQPAYEVDPQRPIGKQIGLARRALDNKALRQATAIASAIAQIGVDRSGLDMLDNGNQTAHKNAIEQAVANVAVKIQTAFIQTWAYAQARTMQDKGRERVSVLDFVGVDPTGSTDSTAAFMAAVATGKKAYAPAGTYKVEILNLPSGTTIEGDGPNATVIKPLTDASRAALGCDSGGSSAFIDNIVLRDLKLLGNVASVGFSEQNHLASFNGVRNLLVDNVHFVGFRGDGLYIGSGNLGGQERHNKNVIVRGCLFDGVNNDNRNGISFIDCDGALVTGNKFQNCTRSNMPGAIDIEPDAAVFHVVKDITVCNNTFRNIGGNLGVICLQLPGIAYSTKPQGFKFYGNDSETSSAAGVSMVFTGTPASETTHDFGITVSDNEFRDSVTPFLMFNIRGARIGENRFIGATNGATVGYSDGSNVIDVDIAGNTFERCGSSSGTGLNVFNATRLDLTKNTFRDCGTGVGGAANAIDFNSGASSAVRLIDNVFTSPTGKTLIAVQKEAGHTFTPSTNEERGNAYGSLVSNFQAYQSDWSDTTYTPTVSGSTTAGTGTYTLQYGRFRKRGKVVEFKLKVAVSAGHTGTGMIQVSLPSLATAAPSNAENVVSVLVDGASTTGGQIGLINPGLNVGGVGAVRCYHTTTGTLAQTTIPAGAFTVYASGSYLEQ